MSTLAELADVTVTRQPDTTLVHLRTTGAARYRTRALQSPPRLVVDLEDTVYGWRKTPLAVDQGPIKEIRGSQYRERTARLVVEFSGRMPYTIREDADGLTIVIPRGNQNVADSPAAAPRATAADPPAAADAGTATPLRAAAASPAGSSAGAPLTPAPRPLARPASAPPREVAQASREVAQASRGTAPVSTNGRLISLDFKDADVVNLLRILAAESGRNIVIGDDVKGKMSISLRNVPWTLALDTILATRGLEKVERDGVMRIVTAEQLTREREARARVEEARVKSEAEVRAKLAEAQVKEAEAIQRKLAAEAARKEQEARGPLREETIRLSYADPEEVAKTLQGILGIPEEGAKITGPGFIGAPGGPPNPELQPYGAPPGPQSLTTLQPVSVSHDVLAKGLTIRAHKPTNTLFLRLYEADLERVKKLIKESLDVPLPQVKIEARMEILDRNALEQIGIQWGGFIAERAGSTTLVGQGLQTTTVAGQTVPFIPGIVQGNTNVVDQTPPINVNSPNPNFILSAPGAGASGGMPVSFQTGLPLGGNLVNLPISALPNAGPLPGFGFAFGIVGKAFNVNLALQALASQGKTRTLARPEIVTVENAKAVMSLGEEIPYATISSAGTQIQFKEALLKLEVTPTVIREGDVTKIKLIVVVENNSRGDVVNLGNAGAPPAINRRKAETQVLIREGDRLIIGGVTTSVNQHTERKVPLLGDIPILGHLFKHRENFESGRELVVFVTPTVLRGPGLTAAASSTTASQSENIPSATPATGDPTPPAPTTPMFPTPAAPALQDAPAR